MPYDLDSMDESIDEIQGSRRSTSRRRYNPVPRLHDEIDDIHEIHEISKDPYYKQKSKPNAIQPAQTFLTMDDFDEYGTKRPGRGRSLSMDSSRPDDLRLFIPAYKNDKDMFKEVPPFSKAELGMDSPMPTKQANSQRTHARAEASPSRRRDSVNERRNDANGQNEEEGTPDEVPRHVPRMPREDEIEAARRILAAAEASNRRELNNHHTRHNSSAAASIQRTKSPPATVRSATPPPIGRPRRYLYDDEDPDQQHKDSGVTPVDVTPPPRTSSRRPPSRQTPRRLVSVASASTMPSRVEPVLDHYQLDDDRHRPPLPHKDSNGTGSVKRMESNINNPRSIRGAESVREADETNSYVRSHESTAGTAKGRLRRTYSDDFSVHRGYAPSSKQSVVSHGSRRMPEFFSEEAFQTVLYNPITAHELQKFSEQRLCGENVEFLAKVGQYQESLTGLGTQLAAIHKSFISDQSPSQINAPRELLLSAHREIKSTMSTTFLSMETLFTDLQKRVEHTVFTDIYPRFVREKVALSAIQALAHDRHKYQGLGDCFCLSDPNKADNPIAFASDGFVKVTGYSRREVVPRNCRFLQGPQTDRETVRNMKRALDARRETVELILNYKKNGDPFWNLLYMAPLFDETGTLAFFIGGQVNCSTTIHSNTDVMKVLAGASAPKEAAVPKRVQQVHRQSSMPSARKALLKAFGVRVEEARTLGEAGMEDQVLGRMEGQELGAQMKEFRTAYSKFLVVRADTFVIHFYSEGVNEMLHPGNNTVGLVTGQEIFRFFKANMVSKETDYRSRVRLAIRNGNPISVEIRLQTRRSALYRGDEKFVTHWTPLKDENSATEWVVITLAPTVG